MLYTIVKSSYFIRCCDLDDVRNRKLHAVTAIASDNKSRAFETVPDGKKCALDEVLHVVGLCEFLNFLT